MIDLLSMVTTSTMEKLKTYLEDVQTNILNRIQFVLQHLVVATFKYGRPKMKGSFLHFCWDFNASNRLNQTANKLFNRPAE